MPQQTVTRRVYLAYQAAAAAYARYSDACQNMPVKPQAGRILYIRGRGFEVNGKVTRMTGDQLVAYYNGLADYYAHMVDGNCEPLHSQLSQWSKDDLYSPVKNVLRPIPEELPEDGRYDG